ncbi:MAG: hypothetical protein MZU91_11115 [Desulfosudis oleivorans]|nr:hypothetical protein [Desulfosudis oleivorans]
MVLDAGRREGLHVRPHVAADEAEDAASPTSTGADWDFVLRRSTRKFLPYINNNYDYAEMVSELLGEMNASHTGCYYSAAAAAHGRRHGLAGPVHATTAYAGPGLKVAEVLRGRPAGQGRASRSGPATSSRRSTARPSTGSVDHYRLLNRKAGQLVLLSVLDPATQARAGRRRSSPFPRGEENGLLYRRWVQRPPRRGRPPVRAARIGYVHVREHERRQLSGRSSRRSSA